MLKIINHLLICKDVQKDIPQNNPVISTSILENAYNIRYKNPIVQPIALIGYQGCITVIKQQFLSKNNTLILSIISPFLFYNFDQKDFFNKNQYLHYFIELCGFVPHMIDSSLLKYYSKNRVDDLITIISKDNWLNNNNFEKLKLKINNNFGSVTNTALLDGFQTTNLINGFISHTFEDSEKAKKISSDGINDKFKDILGTNDIYYQSILYGFGCNYTNDEVYNIINFANILSSGLLKKQYLHGLMIGNKQFTNTALYICNKIFSFQNIGTVNLYTKNDIEAYIKTCYIMFNYNLIGQITSKTLSEFIKALNGIERVQRDLISSALNNTFTVGIAYNSNGLAERDYTEQDKILQNIQTSIMLNTLSTQKSVSNKRTILFVLDENSTIDPAISSRLVKLCPYEHDKTVSKHIIRGYFLRELSNKCHDEFIIFSIKDVLKILYNNLTHQTDIKEIQKSIDMVIYYIIGCKGVVRLEDISNKINY